MRAELSDNPITAYMYASLLVAIGVAVAVIDPMFLLLSAWIMPQGLVALLFWRVTLNETGFAIERRGRTELITFDQVESVSRSLCGLPHIVLTLRPSSAIRRVRFFRDRTVGSVFFGDYRLKRQLEDIISSAARGAENDRAAQQAVQPDPKQPVSMDLVASLASTQPAVHGPVSLFRAG